MIDAIDRLGDNITVILIAHRLNTVRDCDKIFVMSKGEVKAEGSTKIFY